MPAYIAGRWVLILCSNRFFLWDARNRSLGPSQELPDNVSDAAFTQDGSSIVVVGTRYLSVWSMISSQATAKVCGMLSFAHAYHPAFVFFEH
jgi:hypothetical protein